MEFKPNSILCMSKVDLQNNEWCELVFENRNQAYGAYQLRNSYSKHTSKAFILTLVFIACGAFVPLIASFIGDITAPEVAFKADDKIILVDLPPKNPIEEVLPTLPTPAGNPAPTTRFTEYTIVPSHDINDELPPSNDELDTKNLGRTTTEGDPNEPVDISDLNGTGAGTIITETPEEPSLTVSEMPEFVGGEAALMSYIGTNFKYPVHAREAGISGTVYINFIVEKDGSISQVSVANPQRVLGFGCEEEAIRVLNSMPNWKPGRQNGVPKRVQFTVPIKLNLM